MKVSNQVEKTKKKDVVTNHGEMNKNEERDFGQLFFFPSLLLFYHFQL